MTTPTLVPLQRKPYDALIACLREKLEQAERGELTAFAYVCEYVDGNVGQYAFHDVGSNVFKMVGILEALKVRIANRYLGSDEQSEQLD
jgi:hypothetical protein